MKKLNTFEKSCLIALSIIVILVVTSMLAIRDNRFVMALVATISLGVAGGLALASMATIGSAGSNASATRSRSDITVYESVWRKATPAAAGATAAALALLATCLSIATTPSLAVNLVGHTAPDPVGAFYLAAMMVAWITIPCAVVLANEWRSTVLRNTLGVTGFLATVYTFLRYAPSFLI